MNKLVITRGLPASGKTTMARKWVAEDPAHRARVNRDDLRRMLHDGVYLGQDTERQILSARDALIKSLLAKGLDVVCDDTNLPQRKVRELSWIARLAKIDFEVWDLTDVGVEECVARDVARVLTGSPGVGEDVIRDMHTRYLAGRPYPLPNPVEVENAAAPVNLYVARLGTPKAILVDIDGTCALRGTRSPFDETRVHEDRPNAPVVAAIRQMAKRYHVVYCSGRTEGCRIATEDWLHAHVGPVGVLLMRPLGDTRKDAVVKRELFDAHIRDRYDIEFVLDDRNQVVDMWRGLGLAVFQVAPGAF